MRHKRDIITTRIFVKGLTLAVAITVFSIGLVANARGQTPAAVPPEEARAILMRMAEFLAKTQSFSVDVRDSYDVYQESGQKIEFNETRKITLVRPNRLRIDVEESDGDNSIILLDGKDITVTTPSDKVYAQTPQPGNLDAAIIYFVKDLGMKLPFAPLLLSTAPAEIEKRTETLDYVEQTSIFGKPAYHLAGRTASVDYQIWIADGDRPLPQRLVLTYPEADGQPQFRARFSNWNLKPKVPASLFAFAPAPGMEKIAFLAQLPRSAAPPAAKPEEPKTSEKSGGQQ